jgi:tetratricopeptide (TPR) repeat protein
MKYFLIILLSSFVFLDGSIFAQSPDGYNDFTEKQKVINSINSKRRIDSLQLMISKTPDDTTMVMLLLQLSTEQSNDIATATTQTAEKARSLAEKLHYKSGIAFAYQAIGLMYQIRRDYSAAIPYYQHAINVTEAGTNSAKGFYSNLLNLYFYLGDYPHAMETVTRELAGYEKMKEKAGIAHCNNLLGYIYFKQENFSDAEKYYNRYINNTRELHDSTMLAHALGEVADVYTEEKKYDQSVNSLLNVLQICEHGMAPKVNRANYGATIWLLQYKAKAIYRLSRNYKLMGNLADALKYALSAMEFVSGNIVPEYDISSYYINTGDVYKELKDYNKAIT